MKFRFILGLALLGSVKPALAQAVFPFQSTPDITPAQSMFGHHGRATPHLTPLTARPVSQEPEQEQVIIPNLKKIIVSAAKDTPPLTSSAERSEEFHTVTDPFLNHPLTFHTLDLIISQINRIARASDAPFVYVFVPPQKITDGVLNISIESYRVGKIRVTGNRWFSKNLIVSESGLTTGLEPSLNALQSDLDWMNRNPFRSSELIFSPGEKTGETDADIYVSDRFPLYGFAGVNNQNDPSLGRNGWFVGASWGNAFGLDQILTYQLTQTTTGRFFNHTAAWQVPLGPRDSFLVYGNYAKAHPFSPLEYENYGGGGSVSVRWLHQLQHHTLSSLFGFDGTVQIGYDWKTANSYQKVGPLATVIGNADTNQFVFFYSGSVQDPFGKTELSDQLVYGPGGLTRRDHTSDYQGIFLGAETNYVYNRLTASRSFSIGSLAKLNLKMIHQDASKNLLYSEQLMLGGIGTVRGYYLNTSFGSRANLVNVELASNTFSLGKYMNLKHLKDETTASVFWDYGNNTQVRQVVPGIHSATLASVGASLNSKLAHQLTGTLDVGWRLRRVRSVGSKGAVVEYSLICGF